MSKDNFARHLTLDERRIILTGIKNEASKSDIARMLGKDASTIGKEIKAHRVLAYRCTLPLECRNYRHCPYGCRCRKDCSQYEPFRCTRRDRSPGACNGCSDYSRCHFNKYTYNPEHAQQEYQKSLVDSRTGVNLTYEEAHSLAQILKPLLDKGQSLYQILASHPEIRQSEKTLYNYIEGGIFANMNDVSITCMDLRRQVGRKPSKRRQAQYKKRNDCRYLKGRTYKDYQTYIEDSGITDIVQMDTVYNDGSNGPFIQTFKFVKYHFFFAVYQEKRTAEAMTAGVDLLEKILGRELFLKLVPVILTDRGSEFTDPDRIEQDSNGSIRCRVFYCDPMMAGQKGTLENNHHELRDIFPKGTDLKALGLVSQEALNIAVSHIDSMPKEILEGRTPFEYAEFLNPAMVKKFCQAGISAIDKDKVILKPYLLKK